MSASKMLLKNRLTKPVLLVDIGSGSVALAVLSGGVGSTSNILNARRESLKLTEEARPNAAALLPGIIETTKQALSSLTNASPSLIKSVRDVHIVLHAPWASSISAESSTQFDKEHTIRDADISALAKEAIGSITPQEGAVFERAVARTEINGYPTGAPEGKRGVQLRVVALQSSAEEATTSQLRDALLSILPGRTVVFHAATYSFMSILQPLARSVPYYTFIDITSELSEIFVVKNGILTGSHTAAVGWRTLIRALADKYHTTPDDALSRLRMTRDETGTDASCEEVVNSLGELATAITTAYGNAFTALTQTERLPATVILSVPPDVASWFADFFGRIDFSQFSVTEHPFSVQLLMAHHLADKVIFEPGVTPDTGIASSAAFVHILSEQE